VNDLAGKLAGLPGFVFLDPKSLKGGGGRGVTDGPVLIEAVHQARLYFSRRATERFFTT
jgi:hypothetical protein